MTVETDLSIRQLIQKFSEKSLSPSEYWLALETIIEAWGANDRCPLRL